MKRLLVRLFGVRIVEAPTSMRITVPRWMVRRFPGVLERVVSETRHDATVADVRVVGDRSVVVTYR